MDKQVCDVWVKEAWCFEDVVTWLFNETKEQISSIPFSQSNINDGWVWRARADGNYTLASGCAWFLEHRRQWDNSRDWRWVWRLKVLEKIKILVWLCLHGALPTNDLRSSRGLSNGPGYSSYFAAKEDILHYLKDCPQVDEVWLRLGFFQYQSFGGTNVDSWIKHNIKQDNGILFLAAV